MKESSLADPPVLPRLSSHLAPAPLPPSRANPFTWLNLLCLDAPLVAISWQWLFAHNFGIPIARGGTAALFLTAWLIYLADRFGDSLSVVAQAPASLRQRFCQRHRAAWIAGIIGVALADVVIICARLEPRTALVGAAVGASALVYLILNRCRPVFWRKLPLKEVSIGFLFAGGVAVGLSSGLTSSALPAWMLFAGLCSLNCISIAAWERDLDLAQARISIATVFPGIARYLASIGVVLTLACLAFVFADAEARGVSLCLAVSAVLLVGLDFFRKDIAPDLRTALADLVLLTPLVLLLAAGF